MARTRRTFTPEFKLQMVRLFEDGKSKYDIVREYDLTPLALDKWIKNHQHSDSFNTVDEKELRKSSIKDGKRYFKVSSSDHGTKIEVI